MFLNFYSAGKDMEKKPKNVFMWIFENKLFSRLLILWHKTIEKLNKSEVQIAEIILQ